MPDPHDPWTPGPEKADLGILLVHGIGEQAQGETLTKFAEPIVDWIRDFLHREAPIGSLVASTPVDAALRPPLLAPDIPAHARVVIGAGAADALVQQWLFAEAWWGPQVLTPSISSFTAWLVTRGPWLMLFHFNQHKLLASPRVHTALKWLIGLPLSIVWMVLSLLMSTVLVAASLIALIPIGRVRRVVYTVLRQIAGVVGDAYGQLRSPIQRVAFERATLDAMKWLRPQCKRLAVIAHSQGAAIAHRALRGGEPRADLLVTVGAGIVKLEALRYLERLGPSDRIAAFLAPLVLLAAGAVALRTRALGLTDFDSTILLPGAIGAFGVGLLAQVWLTVRGALRNLREQSERLSLAEAQPGLRWVDIVASHDPVPAGELSRFFDLAMIDSQEIPVLRSRLADHTSYWTARASFMQTLVPRLGTCAELPQLAESNAGVADRLGAAERRLERDLRVLSIARVLDALAFVVPLIFASDRLIAGVDRLRVVLGSRGVSGTTGAQAAPFRFIEEAINNVELALRWTADIITGDPGTWARPVVNVAVAALLLAIVLLGWQRLEFAVWQAWSAGRNEKTLRGPLKLDGIREDRVIETRLFVRLSATLANLAVAATLLLAVSVSAAWSVAPGWADEARVYSVLAAIAAGVFVLVMVFGFVAENTKEFVKVRQTWRQFRSEHPEFIWPNIQAVVSRIIDVAIGLLVVWLTIDRVVTLPAFAKPQIIYIGVLALLRMFMALLDSIWRRLDRARASTATRVTLLTLPPAIGAAAASSLFFATLTEPVEVSAILSGVMVVGCIVAGLIVLALRMTRVAN